MKNPIDETYPKIGWEAQKKMAPEYRVRPLSAREIEARNPRKAAVLCLWFQREGNWHFPLIQRAAYQGVHSSQISFPGGQWEKEDESLAHTAIRETEEEIGIHFPSQVPLHELSDLYIPPSNFWVQPFMSFVTQDFVFKKDEVEVAEIVVVSMSQLMKAEIKNEKNVKGNYPYFDLQGKQVWGATAMILNEIKEIISLSL